MTKEYDLSVEELIGFEAGRQAVSDIVGAFLLSKLAELRQAREVVARVEETRGVFDFSAGNAARPRTT